MPDPISSSSSSQSSSNLDSTLDEAGLVCRSDAPNSSEPEPAPPPASSVVKLVSSLPPPATALPPPAPKSVPPPEAQNNAQRTSERSGISGYADYGITGGARDSVYAGVAALKGRDAKTGLEVEVFSASGQVGGENELQLGLARMGLSGKHGSVTAEFLTVRANGGAHNDDGSNGGNASALATGSGIEGTLSFNGAESLTVGVAVGGGGGFSAGVRDIDHDGRPELCWKASFEVVTLGMCVEAPK